MADIEVVWDWIDFKALLIPLHYGALTFYSTKAAEDSPSHVGGATPEAQIDSSSLFCPWTLFCQCILFLQGGKIERTSMWVLIWAKETKCRSVPNKMFAFCFGNVFLSEPSDGLVLLILPVTAQGLHWKSQGTFLWESLSAVNQLWIENLLLFPKWYVHLSASSCPQLQPPGPACSTWTNSTCDLEAKGSYE